MSPLESVAAAAAVGAPSEQDFMYEFWAGLWYNTDEENEPRDNLPSCAHDILFVREDVRA